MAQARNKGTASALALTDRQKDDQATIAKYLEAQTPAIMEALPGAMDANRFRRIILTEVRRNTALLAADPLSLVAAAMEAAQLGLEIGSGLGQAYLIPRKIDGKQMVCFQKGYRGIRKLLSNSPGVSAVFAKAVLEGDDFEEQAGTRNEIVHVPRHTAPSLKANVLCVYAAAKIHGEWQFEVMTFDEIESHRKRYVRSKSGPWFDDAEWVQMALKTVLLRLAKQLPLSAEIAHAVAADETVKRTLVPDMTLEPDIEEGAADADEIGATIEEEVTDEDLLKAQEEAKQRTGA